MSNQTCCSLKQCLPSGMCPGSCCCCTWDAEGQWFGLILFHYQCGILPCKCFDYDNDGMCWGCVCCQCQIDGCFLPRWEYNIQIININKITIIINRNALHFCCSISPCGCIAEETIVTLCCCKPGRETVDPQTHKI